MPPAILLDYGAFGPAATASYSRYGGLAYTLTMKEMDRFWANYAGTSTLAEIVAAHPRRALPQPP